MSHPVMNRRQLIGVSAAALGAACASPAAGADATRALDGKTILITGAASGFGRAGAEHYARLGARVFATMRNLPRPEAAELEKLAADEGLAIEVVEIDVMSGDSVRSGVAAVLAKTGGTLDVLINNAGIGLGGPMEVQDMEATKLLFNTNVFGAHRMALAVLPAMRAAKSGQIFQISSQLGRVIAPGLGHYSPTKFALEALSEGMAYELVPHGIEVTIIQPGGYPTAIWTKSRDRADALLSRTQQAVLDAYPEITAGMRETRTGGTTDPMDIPRAIAEIIQMQRGTRPLRRPVHPGPKPQEAINEVSRQTQLAMLGNSPFGPWVRDVLD
ncbi:MAG: SDR family oxidoreductase [Hyphomonas sp.]